MIIANNDFPARTPAELIAALKAKPGAYSFATSGVGTVQHLGFALLEGRTGIVANHVPYRGASQTFPDVISGQVPLGVVSATAWLAQARGGKLRALANLVKLRCKTLIPLAAGQNEGLASRFRDLLVAQARRRNATERLDQRRLHAVREGGRHGGGIQYPLRQRRRLAASQHAPARGLANGTLGEYYTVAVDCCKPVFDGLPEPKAGTLALPEQPGLGFAPDRARIADLRKHPLSRGAGKA